MFTTKYPIQWKNFSDGKMYSSMAVVSRSFTGYYHTLCNTINNLHMLGYDINTLFVLCPVYVNNKNIISDFEFSVGGTEKYGETPDTAAFREVGEELGLILNNKDDRYGNYYQGTNMVKGRTYTGYAVPTTNMRFITKADKVELQPTLADTYDRKKYKINCIVYGSFEDIQEKIKHNKQIHVFDNKDGIVGVGYQPLIFLWEMCSKQNFKLDGAIKHKTKTKTKAKPKPKRKSPTNKKRSRGKKRKTNRSR